MRPNSFEKIETNDIKEIIDQCIRLNKEERPLVKDLLTHEFFAEDPGLKIELVNRGDEKADANKVEFRLRVVDPKKRCNKYRENEAIQFEFDIDRDIVEEVAQDMVSHLNLTLKNCSQCLLTLI